MALVTSLQAQDQAVLDASSTDDGAGVFGDEVTLNAFEVAAIGGGAVLGVNAVAVLATIAPAYTLTVGGASAAAAYVGHCKREGKSILPWSDEGFALPGQSKDKATTPTPATTAATTDEVVTA